MYFHRASMSSFVSSFIATLSLAALASACSSDEDIVTYDPATAERVEVDRFSAAAGNLLVRTDTNGLPAANEPIDFDQAPFITRGLGPNGESVQYYNFDVQPLAPAPIYVLIREGESAPVQGQLNVIDVIPGDEGYSDFWQVVRVTVPADYVANEVASLDEILDAGYSLEPTDALVNCPVVPQGSTAQYRGGGESNQLTQGWYKGMLVHYFSFLEAGLTTTGSVPVSPIYVTFNVNPDAANVNSGPASGFVTETGSDQTHNVLGSLPGDPGYSPLWLVNVYNNADFDAVTDLASIGNVEILAGGVANVNCPVVDITR